MTIYITVLVSYLYIHLQAPEIWLANIKQFTHVNFFGCGKLLLCATGS